MFEKLFPFHFVLNRFLQLVQKGRSLSKLIDDKQGNFENIFTFKRPFLSIDYNFDSIINCIGQIFILEVIDTKIFLKGEFVYSETQDLLFFCGTPWLGYENILKSDFNIGDFAIHSNIIEYSNFLNNAVSEFESKLEISEAFEKQRQFFEKLFDEIPVDMAIIDMERKFRYLNKTAVKDPELRNWLIGRTNFDYFIRKNLDLELGRQREEFIQKAIESGESIRFEDVHNKNTEKETVMLRSLSPFTAYDGQKYMLAYGMDLSIFKRTVFQNEQKNLELENLNNILNSIIYAVTHDFRAPILAVKALAYLVKSGLEINERNDLLFNLIKTSITKLDDQIIDIHNYLQNSKLEIGFTEVNISEIAENAFEMVRYSVPYPIVFKVEMHQKTPFITDFHRIKIVINNLISNAVKYSRKTTNAFVNIKVVIDDENCHFTVSDNGDGISEMYVDKVFDIYFRASNKTGGTGLGLFICAEIIKKLGGKIEVKSVLGEGSSFSVTVPNNKSS